MKCYECNTPVFKGQELCSSCGIPLKLIASNWEEFSKGAVEYQNEWFKIQEDLTKEASNKSVIPFFGIFYGLKSVFLCREGCKRATLVKKRDIATKLIYIRRLAILGLTTNLIGLLFVIIGIINLIRNP